MLIVPRSPWARGVAYRTRNESVEVRTTRASRQCTPSVDTSTVARATCWSRAGVLNERPNVVGPGATYPASVGGGTYDGVRIGWRAAPCAEWKVHTSSTFVESVQVRALGCETAVSSKVRRSRGTSTA